MLSHTVEKLMSISRAEFEASLAALDADAKLDAAGQARVGFGGTEALIRFEPLPERRLGGLLALPQARVRITLSSGDTTIQAAFLRRFEIAFQRGGG